MQIEINSKNFNVSEKLEELIKQKVKKLERYFSDSADIKVVCRKEKERNIMELNIIDNGMTYRSEVVSDNMYDNIDLALPKIERQLYKHRDKVKSKLKAEAFIPQELLFAPEAIEAITKPNIARTKAFQVYPYTVEEAQERLENLDLQFFIFLNTKTNVVNVIYKRADGDYGVIEPIY